MTDEGECLVGVLVDGGEEKTVEDAGEVLKVG